MGQQVNVYRKLKLWPGAVVEGSWNGSYDVGGRTYYVNNATGSSTADGLSWNSAMAEVNDAITASAAWLALQATGNTWIQNTIVVRGVEDAYAAITAAPNTCRIIGLGVTPNGSWGSIARIASATTCMVGDSRGMELYNLRFESYGGSAYNIISIPNSLGMVMEDCALMSHNENGTTRLNAAIGGTVTVWAGHVLRRNRIGGAGGALGCSMGIDLTATNPTTWNNCLIENNIIEATSYGIRGHALANAQGTLVRDNDFFGQTDDGTGAVMTYGIQASLYMHSHGNRFSASDGLRDNESYQTVGDTIVTS